MALEVIHPLTETQFICGVTRINAAGRIFPGLLLYSNIIQYLGRHISNLYQISTRG